MSFPPAPASNSSRSRSHSNFVSNCLETNSNLNTSSPSQSPSPPPPFGPRHFIPPPETLSPGEKYRVRRLLRHIKYRFNNLLDEILDELDIDFEDGTDAGYPRPRRTGPGPHAFGIYPRRPRSPNQPPSPTVEELRTLALQRLTSDRAEAQEVEQALLVPPPLHPSSDDEAGPSLPPSVSRHTLLVDRSSQSWPIVYCPEVPPLEDVVPESVIWTPENPLTPGNDFALLQLHDELLVCHEIFRNPGPHAGRNSYTPEEGVAHLIHQVNQRLVNIGHGHIKLSYDFDKYRPVGSQ